MTRRFSLLLAVLIAAMLVLSAPLAAFAGDSDMNACSKKCVKECVKDCLKDCKDKDKDKDKKCPPKKDKKHKKCPKKDTRPGWGYGDKNHVHTGPPGLFR